MFFPQTLMHLTVSNKTIKRLFELSKQNHKILKELDKYDTFKLMIVQGSILEPALL